MIRATITLNLMLTLFFAATADAQRPGQPRPDGPPPGRQPGGPPIGPPGFHLMTALDVNKDGKISSQEIASASVALQKLDKDKDGKLSKEEIGWPPPGFPAGGFGPRGPGGQRGGGGFFFGPGGPGGFPGFGGDDGGRPRRPNTADASKKRKFFSVKQIQGLDRNKDGKIVESEVPKGLRKLIFGRVDVNKDGTIDQAEVAKLAKSSAAQDKQDKATEKP